MLGLSLPDILRIVPAILIGLTVHELAHAFIALRLGDDTAKQLGRVTLNPLKHIDPMGFIMLLVAGFGWAKPVLIDRKKLKNPARDDVLVALSGPTANLLLAVVLVLLLRVVIYLVDFRSERTFNLVVFNFITWISINISFRLSIYAPSPEKNIA